MSTEICQMKRYAVSIGETVLYLSAYQLTGSCLVREQGTAAGAGAVTACWPNGTRLMLKGRLADTAPAAALDAILRAGTTQTLQLGTIVYSSARLIGYRISEGEDVPELMLLFHTAAAVTEEVPE